MTILLSISPANRVRVDSVVIVFAVTVTDPRAIRKPGAMAVMVYVPAGSVKSKTSPGLTVPEVATELSGLNKVTTTGLTASTLLSTVPMGVMGVEVAVGEAVIVGVNVGVGDSPGVAVNVG